MKMKLEEENGSVDDRYLINNYDTFPQKIVLIKHQIIVVVIGLQHPLFCWTKSKNKFLRRWNNSLAGASITFPSPGISHDYKSEKNTFLVYNLYIKSLNVLVI